MKSLVFGLVSVTAIIFAMSLSSCSSAGHRGHKHECACGEAKKTDGCSHCKEKKGCDGCEVKDEKKP
ncbi:MAG: hypothetical protein KF681_13945 [Bdellovibrionaceae bacterium]|nr:hypothetical protein [Pseudobdellovibrionaceae bacterium]